ncbi:DUF1836 domain-containing protein [Bacillus sp. 1P06AnD]|uniref:DUF1836 domain-containing protein n=1 Tax=Bacillus sp. 1P06AnD TaxID=3132208 RepID=UPI0039A1C878
MDTIQAFIEKMEKEQTMTLEDIPEIDLYMDQVIQLFENKFSESKRNEEDKILTKTMINNYAKGKLFFPIKNKKYSKNHLILISLIYQLKGILSINDIKETLSDLNGEVSKGKGLESFYASYLQVQQENSGHFKKAAKTLEEEATSFIGTDEQGLGDILKVASLVHMSQLYKRAAESLVDELKGRHPEE